jgi:hypothetical protein
MAGMSAYPFKCDLCGGVTDAPTYGDFACQHCGQVFVYEECHQIKLSERQLKTLRDSRWIPVSERLPEDGETVLLWNYVDHRLGWLKYTANGVAYFFSTQDETNIQPTHWMPLPEPPAE